MKLLAIMLAFTSMNVFGWGTTGHRAVGEIAEKFLTQASLKKVNKILGGQSLARVSTWADEIKSDPTNYSHTYNWHYTDWPDSQDRHDETSSSGFLIKSTGELLAVLKSPTSTDAQKTFALKFIVHLIGDLHMPLHVGNGLDQGGNSCKVTFHGKATNLHALWDEGMIAMTNLSYTELTAFLLQGLPSEAITRYRQGTILDWALESKKIRATVYPPAVTPSTLPMSVNQYCRSDIAVLPEEMPKLGYEYSYKFIPVIEERLVQAGIRLATLIEANLPK